jgi:phospholipid/cholesterol/gamma-HCH transport system substrate-binding protein
MKTSVETRARVAFAIFLLLGAAGGAAWYLIRSSAYATFQIRTRDPVSGLIADSPVEFHGVEVGKVKSLELTDPHTVSILLSIKKDAPVSTATVATITGRGLATRGFTGYVYVSLENLGAEARPLTAPSGSPFPVIPTAPSRSVNLDTAISQLNQNVQAMTDLVQAVLDQKTIASLKLSVDGLQRVTQTLAANQHKLAATIANGERASARLEPLLRSSEDSVRMLQGQILPEAYRTLAKLDQLSTSLSDVTAKIKRDPSVVIRGSSAPPGPGERR